MDDKQAEHDALQLIFKQMREGKEVLKPNDFDAIAKGTFDYVGFLERHKSDKAQPGDDLKKELQD